MEMSTQFESKNCLVATDRTCIMLEGVTYLPRPASPITNAANTFHDANSLTELIFQLAGATSMCWVGGTGSLEFDSARARELSDAAIERLIELAWA